MRVEGQLVFNNIALRLNAALAGFGLIYLPEDMVKTHIAKRQLVRVLADWCPDFFRLPPVLPKSPPPHTGL